MHFLPNEMERNAQICYFQNNIVVRLYSAYVTQSAMLFHDNYSRFHIIIWGFFKLVVNHILNRKHRT